jgi:hypothetical protein
MQMELSLKVLLIEDSIGELGSFGGFYSFPYSHRRQSSLPNSIR